MIKWASFWLILACLTSCYSFKGISVPADIQSFGLEPIIDQSQSSPPTYINTLTDQIITKFRRESRLNYVAGPTADLVFKCVITQFNVNSYAPVAGAVSAVNRLSVTLDVECINTKNETANWKQSFTRFEDFDVTANFSSESDRLIASINKFLIEDVFTKAFTNW
ncbi:MAG TPA: LPS assembly lipoprotein LptE [Saprospiraceae bacterium]|nr:LPS assembly lipoprotein LptE [Saprospiraceae bacterium]